MTNLEHTDPRTDFENSTGVYEHARFGRVITAMVTPFTVDGSAVNYEAAQQLAMHLEANGSEGLVVAGTTGESATLSHSEQLDLITAVHEAVGIPVLAGTGSNNTAEAESLSTEVSERGIADGLLVVSPYYNRPPQSGIVDYFERVSASSELPIVMYDIPVRTGRLMSTDTILELASEQTNIVGLKDAAGNPDRTKTLLRDAPEGFQVYSGDDSLNLRFYRAGAVGAISVAAHWAGTAMQQLFDYEDSKDTRAADFLDEIMGASYDFVSSEAAPNPIPTKAMMRRLLSGLVSIGYSRSPMTVSQKTEDGLERAGLIVSSDLTYLVSQMLRGNH
jgi:4-hydroxy-tetrahydrodipicolinate synthase